MAYQETKTTSYGGRLSKALKGIVTGFVMFIGGTCLLFWNEGNFVKSQRALKEAQGATVAVDSVAALDQALEGKLIHASAHAETADILRDAQFGVEVNAIALKRSAEYYQWQEESKTETRDKIGGSEEEVTTYTYSKAWVSAPIDSNKFHDPEYQGKNWCWIEFPVEKQYAANVSFGAYRLPDFFIEAIRGDEKVAPQPAEERIAEWNKIIDQHPSQSVGSDVAGGDKVHINDNTVYFGRHASAPEIGDVRVTFVKIMPKEVSLLGKVKGDTFVQFVAKNGKKVSRLENGIVSVEEMYAHAHHENKILTWILRLVGVILVCGGLRAIFGIFEAIAKVIPFLGNIVGAGVGLVCMIVGLAWSLVWIAIAWLTYRPLVGVPLLVIAVGGLYWLKTIGKKKAPVSDTVQ